MNPRITMQTKPLSPFCATSYPDFVSTLMVARPEMFAGAALWASAISSACGMKYCSMGGYFRVCEADWARKVVGNKLATSKYARKVNRFLMVNILLFVSLLPAITDARGARIRENFAHLPIAESRGGPVGAIKYAPAESAWR